MKKAIFIYDVGEVTYVVYEELRRVLANTEFDNRRLMHLALEEWFKLILSKTNLYFVELYETNWLPLEAMKTLHHLKMDYEVYIYNKIKVPHEFSLRHVHVELRDTDLYLHYSL